MLRKLLIAILVGLFALPGIQAKSNSLIQDVLGDKPPGPQGGEWLDDFWVEQMAYYKNVELRSGHLLLNLDEDFHWKQTWTAHFAEGEFFQTEAISDSVRLAQNGPGQYFPTGIYTSTILNAGKPVDWTSSSWTYAGVPGSLLVEYRTGNTPTPDPGWTDWSAPKMSPIEYLCVNIIGSSVMDCTSNMSGIHSSQFIQYRVSFDSPDTTKTIALEEIDLLYGTHPLAGTASSILVAPMDLRGWEEVMISVTVPASTALTIDILAPDGTVLIQNAGNGTKLTNIDPHLYTALQLRATITTTDPSLSPDLDLWGLRWTVVRRLYLPAIVQ